MRSKIKKPFYKKWWFIGIVFLALVGSFAPSENDVPEDNTILTSIENTTEPTMAELENDKPNVLIPNEVIQSSTETYEPTPEISLSQKVAGVSTIQETSNSYEFNGTTYKILEVDGGDLSGDRQPNVAVNIGFGDRNYWAFTNEHSQLVYIIADTIILQDELNEPVLSTGRYYSDEAKVPGTESPDLDEGHVIADSLGGVANAYNITPQDSILNRHGDQAYMEKVIRDAGGCTNFIATITYASANTQIPLKYKYEYEIFGEKVVDEFLNINPDKANEVIVLTTEAKTEPKTEAPTSKPTEPTNSFDEPAELKRVDTNGNGKVTIAEAKAAGFKMPIFKDHWLYKYMDDRDGDGQVGE